MKILKPLLPRPLLMLLPLLLLRFRQRSAKAKNMPHHNREKNDDRAAVAFSLRARNQVDVGASARLALASGVYFDTTTPTRPGFWHTYIPVYHTNTNKITRESTYPN
mmetsp:Transcript_21545/g.44229  ORF Transcript_21545/g.44229 Transcript_21545/m.44229 type:complete len:107 (-) Transcript_21545:8-328(-)